MDVDDTVLSEDQVEKVRALCAMGKELHAELTRVLAENSSIPLPEPEPEP